MRDHETTRLEALMAEHKLSAEWTSAEGFHLDDQGWEHQLFRFRLELAGEELGSNIAFRQGMAHEDDPSAVTLAGAILSDAACAAPHEDWLDFAEELGYLDEGGAASARKARDAYRACRAWHELLAERLAPEVLEELYNAAGEL